ncbi:MAG: nitroreductase family protein [Bacilli bacterium]
MDFFELINKRYSCRHFSDQKIDHEKLEQIVNFARLAPSAVNGQPWFVHIVQTEDILNKAKAACTYLGMNWFVRKAQALLIVTEATDNIISSTISKMKDVDFKTLDIGIFTAHLTLGATSLDIGSCILGWFNENQLKDALNLSKSSKVRIVIALGYPENANHKTKNRKDIDQIRKYY